MNHETMMKQVVDEIIKLKYPDFQKMTLQERFDVRFNMLNSLNAKLPRILAKLYMELK